MEDKKRITEQDKIEILLVLLNAMNINVENAFVCEFVCFIVQNILEANFTAQKHAYEEGYVDILLRILKIHGNQKCVCELSCRVLAIIFSSEDLHSEFCTKDVLNAVQECSINHVYSEKIYQLFLSFTRKEELRVKDAVARGVCTGDVFPKCVDCKLDENGYCPRCCVQQKTFRCFTCDKEKIKVYCETCWKRDHQGHKGEEFFYPTRCATKQQTPNGFNFDFSPELIRLIRSIGFERKVTRVMYETKCSINK